MKTTIMTVLALSAVVWVGAQVATNVPVGDPTLELHPISQVRIDYGRQAVTVVRAGVASGTRTYRVTDMTAWAVLTNAVLTAAPGAR